MTNKGKSRENTVAKKKNAHPEKITSHYQKKSSSSRGCALRVNCQRGSKLQYTFASKILRNGPTLDDFLLPF